MNGELFLINDIDGDYIFYMVDLGVEKHEAQVYLLWGCGIVGKFLEEVLAVLEGRVHEGYGILFRSVVLYS